MVDKKLVIKLIESEIVNQKSKLTLDFEKDRVAYGIIIELEDIINKINKEKE